MTDKEMEEMEAAVKTADKKSIAEHAISCERNWSILKITILPIIILLVIIALAGYNKMVNTAKGIAANKLMERTARNDIRLIRQEQFELERQIEKRKYDQKLFESSKDINQVKDDIELKTRTFSWNHEGQAYSVQIILNEKSNDSCSYLNKQLTNSFTPAYLEVFCDNLIKQSAGKSIINQLTRDIIRAGKENNITKKDEQIKLILSFIQSIPYDKGKLNQAIAGNKIEYSSPYEILYDNTGVCLGKSLLGIEMLKELTNVCLFYYPTLIGTEEKLGHAVIGIKTNIGSTLHSYNNINYKYGESTAKIELGIIPKLINGSMEEGTLYEYENTYGECETILHK